MILQSLQILLRFACESSQPGKTKSYPAYGANNFLRSTSSHFHENDDGVHKLSRWDHSTTTWTEFCHSPPPTLPCVENFYTLIVGKSRHFLAPSLRHHVHVVIEWPLGDGWTKSLATFMLPERFRYPPMGRRNETFLGKPTASFTSISKKKIVNLSVDYPF